MKSTDPTRPSAVVRAVVLVGLVAACLAGMAAAARASDKATEKRYFLRAKGKSWHSVWYDPSIGKPLALVVPPTTEFTSEYSWGVPSSRVMPLYNQFQRPYPGAGAVPGSGGGMYPTPYWPSDTVQFGVHSVRGPW
ncbi:MAG: hypothetical protein DWH79_10790 [Planctomycetota bacterium]|nr:MAG: hypothetical protein DWH79_10790 [Planctomycetota bacterium]